MKQFGSLVNYIKTVATKGMPAPQVGMGATLLCYTDRHACTVTKVFEVSKKLYVEVQQDFAVRIDGNGMSECQKYDFKPNPNGSTYTYRWCEKKQRWLKVFFIITMQFPLGIQPALRTNVDYVFILREPYMNNRRRLFENYGSAFPSFEFFCQMMDQCTQNYECIVINNNTQSNKLEDTIFWYKAEVHGEFKMGAPELWRQSEMIARVKEEEEINNYDPRGSMKLRGPAINVQKKY